MERGAILDQTGVFRYSLWREWSDRSAKVGFVMLNPSRADALVDDPTIRRCIGFAQTWGFGGLQVVNLFAYRTAHPRELRQIKNPIGADNDYYLAFMEQQVDRIILAWGNGGILHDRDQAVLQLLGKQKPVYCLGTTQTGQPKHPLYVRSDTQLMPFQALL